MWSRLFLKVSILISSETTFLDTGGPRIETLRPRQWKMLSTNLGTVIFRLPVYQNGKSVSVLEFSHEKSWNSCFLTCIIFMTKQNFCFGSKLKRNYQFSETENTSFWNRKSLSLPIKYMFQSQKMMKISFSDMTM